MDKPKTVLLLCLYLVLGSLYSFFTLAVNIFYNKLEIWGTTITFWDTVKINPMVGVVYALVVFTNLATLIFAYQFYALKKSSLMAAHIAFSLTMIVLLAPIFVRSIYTLKVDILSILITAVVWWAVYDFIKNKKTPEGQLIFN